jgi:hypothetical protein
VANSSAKPATRASLSLLAARRGDERRDLRGALGRVGGPLRAGLVLERVGGVGPVGGTLPAQPGRDDGQQPQLRAGAGLVGPDRLDRVQPGR